MADSRISAAHFQSARPRKLVLPLAMLTILIVTTTIAPSVAVLAAIALAIALGTTLWPLATMGIVMVLIPVVDQVFSEPDATNAFGVLRPTSGTVLKAITAIVVVAYLWRHRINPWRYRLLRMPLIFVIYTFALCFRFHDHAMSLSIWLRATYSMVLLVFFYAACVHEKQAARKALWLWGAGGVALILLVASVFLSKAMGVVGGYYGAGEAYGFYDAPWNMAISLPTLIVLPLTYIGMKARNRTAVAVVCCILVGCTFLASYMTMVRTSLVSCVAALFVFGFIVVRSGSRKAVVAGTLAFVISVGAIYVVYTAATGRAPISMGDRWAEVETHGDIGSGRLMLWYAAYSHFRTTSVATKIIGEGFGISPEVTADYLGTPFAMHNEFIDVLLAGGVVSLYLYINMFIGFYRAAWRGLRQESHWGLACFLVLVVYTVSSLTTGMRLGSVTANTYFALIAGTCLGMLHRNSEGVVD